MCVKLLPEPRLAKIHYVIWRSYGIPDRKGCGANMGPIWGRQDPDGPHVGPMNFAIWDFIQWCHIASYLLINAARVIWT